MAGRAPRAPLHRGTAPRPPASAARARIRTHSTAQHRPVEAERGRQRAPGSRHRASGAASDGMGSEPESVQLRATAASPDRDLQPLKDAAGEPDADYDPHEHRVLADPTNNWETLVHLVKCSLGTGILAMPQAFARAGLGTGALGTLLAGALVTHCLHVLVRAQYAACRRRRVPLLSYPAAMAAALEAGPEPLRRLAAPAALTVDVFLVVYQLGICCVYIVFIADNIKKVVDPVRELPVEAYMGMLLAPLVAFNLIPSLKLLAPFSALANALTLVGLGIVLYYLLGTEGPAANSDEPLDLWGSAATFPLFFGTILFALTAVGVVIALENNMATPRAFGAPCGVLNSGMALIVLLYVAVGALGYAYCGAACKDSITLDLPAGPSTGDRRDRDVRGGDLHQLRAALLRAGGGGVALRARAHAGARLAAHAAPRGDRAARRAVSPHIRAGGGGASARAVHLAVRRAVPVRAGDLLPGADGGVPRAPAPGGDAAEGRTAVRRGPGRPRRRHVHRAGGDHRLLRTEPLAPRVRTLRRHRLPARLTGPRRAPTPAAGRIGFLSADEGSTRCDRWYPGSGAGVSVMRGGGRSGNRLPPAADRTPSIADKNIHNLG